MANLLGVSDNFYRIMSDNNTVNIALVLKRIVARKSLFVKVGVIALVASSVYIFFVPRYYESSVLLAPEISDISGKSSLSSIASSFGFNVGNSSSGDAIYPDLYPELINTNDFVVNLIGHKVTTANGTLTTTYYDYLLKHQKESPWQFPYKLIGAVKQWLAKSPSAASTPKAINLFKLTPDETAVFDMIKGAVGCTIDTKTGIITITVQDQDPLIAATMADAAKTELQKAIIRYRTSKAQVDLDYYRKLTAEAKAKYERARQLYGSYADANTEVVLESYKAKQNDLENDMQLKYNTYSTLNTQLQQAIAKVQENTPVFTVIKGATVPLQPAGPKRMVFVLVVLVFALLATVLYVCRAELVRLFTKGL